MFSATNTDEVTLADEQRARRELKKTGHLLKKRNGGYMIVVARYNAIVAGSHPDYGMDFQDVINWING